MRRRRGWSPLVINLVNFYVCVLALWVGEDTFIAYVLKGSFDFARAIEHALRHRADYSSLNELRWLFSGPPYISPPPARAPPELTLGNSAGEQLFEDAVLRRQPRVIRGSPAMTHWLQIQDYGGGEGEDKDEGNKYEHNSMHLQSDRVYSAERQSGTRETKVKRVPSRNSTYQQSTRMGAVDFVRLFDRNSSVTFDCQRQRNRPGGFATFMYYDKNQNRSALLQDKPMAGVLRKMYGSRKADGVNGFGDGGKVEAINGVPAGEWLIRVMRASAKQNQNRQQLHCVEEIEFSWGWNEKERGKTASKSNNMATSLHRDESDLHPLSPLSALLEPFLRPLAWMAVFDETAAPRQKVVTHFWAHSAGAVSQLHYDEDHNILVQLIGTKRVTLFPPDSLACLHLFPTLHPRARKSQAPLHLFGQPAGSGQGGHRAAKNGDNRGKPLFPNLHRFATKGIFSSPDHAPSPLERQFPRFFDYISRGHCSRHTAAIFPEQDTELSLSSSSLSSSESSDVPLSTNSGNAESRISSTFPLATSYLSTLWERTVTVGGSLALLVDSFLRKSTSLMTSGPYTFSPVTRPYVYTLQPGEALYIPPFWAHHVEASPASSDGGNFDGPSISVNAFSPSHEGAALSTLLHGQSLPFDTSWPSRVTARAVRCYLMLFAEGLGWHSESTAASSTMSVLTVEGLVRDMLESRYGQHRRRAWPQVFENDAEVALHVGSSGIANGGVNVDEENEEEEEEEGGGGGGGGGGRWHGEWGNGTVKDEDLIEPKFNTRYHEEWLPWCREPAADESILRASPDFAQIAMKHGREAKKIAPSGAAAFLTKLWDNTRVRHSYFQSSASSDRGPSIKSEWLNDIDRFRENLWAGQGGNQKAFERLALEEFFEMIIGHFFGPDSIPLYLCACFSPLPNRRVLRGRNRVGLAFLASCTKQWDMHAAKQQGRWAA